MNIDRENYESFFIDYLDGQLSLGEIDQLLDFLNENPELKEELKGLESIKLELPEVSIPSFQHLLKSDLDHPDLFEETCIRAVENDLQNHEQKLFRQYLYENKDKQKEYELFQSTISEPDPFIIYEHKQLLKKKKPLAFSYVWYAAAVIVLGVFLMLPGKKLTIETPNIQLTEAAKPVKEVIPVSNNKEASITRVSKKVRIVKPVLKEQKPEQLAEVKREPVFIEPLAQINNQVIPESAGFTDYSLASVVNPVNPMLVKPKSYSKYLTLPEYFANRLDDYENKGTIGKFALNALKRITGDKFDYTTKPDGSIEKLEYNSKMLAFTIPVNE